MYRVADTMSAETGGRMNTNVIAGITGNTEAIAGIFIVIGLIIVILQNESFADKPF